MNTKSIDGIDIITIQTVLAEVGSDLSAWKTEAHWSSWLNLAPKRDISGGRVIRHVREHQSRRQCLSHGRSIAAAQSKLSGSPLPIPARQVGRAESRQSHGTGSGLAILSTHHQGTGMGGSGRSEAFNRRSQQRELAALHAKLASTECNSYTLPEAHCKYFSARRACKESTEPRPSSASTHKWVHGIPLL